MNEEEQQKDTGVRSFHLTVTHDIVHNDIKTWAKSCPFSYEGGQGLNWNIPTDESHDITCFVTVAFTPETIPTDETISAWMKTAGDIANVTGIRCLEWPQGNGFFFLKGENKGAAPEQSEKEQKKIDIYIATDDLLDNNTIIEWASSFPYADKTKTTISWKWSDDSKRKSVLVSFSINQELTAENLKEWIATADNMNAKVTVNTKNDIIGGDYLYTTKRAA